MLYYINTDFFFNSINNSLIFYHSSNTIPIVWLLLLLPQLQPSLCHHTNIALSLSEKSERIAMLYFCYFAWWRLPDANWRLRSPACLHACLPDGLLVGSWLWSASGYRFVATLSLMPSSAVVIVVVCCCCSTFHYLFKYTFISFECFSVGSHLAHSNNNNKFCSLIPHCVCTWMSCGCALDDIWYILPSVVVAAMLLLLLLLMAVALVVGTFFNVVNAHRNFSTITAPHIRWLYSRNIWPMGIIVLFS